MSLMILLFYLRSFGLSPIPKYKFSSAHHLQCKLPDFCCWGGEVKVLAEEMPYPLLKWYYSGCVWQICPGKALLGLCLNIKHLCFYVSWHSWLCYAIPLIIKGYILLKCKAKCITLLMINFQTINNLKICSFTLVFLNKFYYTEYELVNRVSDSDRLDTEVVIIWLVCWKEILMHNSLET